MSRRSTGELPTTAVLTAAGLGLYGAVLTMQVISRIVIRVAPWYAPLAPLGVLVTVYIVLRSSYRSIRGVGVTWKGRTYVDGKGSRQP